MDPEDEGVKEKKEKIDDLARRSELSKQMQEIVGTYIMMEEYYMREMAHKVSTRNLLYTYKDNSNHRLLLWMIWILVQLPPVWWMIHSIY